VILCVGVCIALSVAMMRICALWIAVIGFRGVFILLYSVFLILLAKQTLATLRQGVSLMNCIAMILMPALLILVILSRDAGMSLLSVMMMMLVPMIPV